ncbi:MAG: NUDIX hydrolase [Bacteroidaceae bacterium]|nr:NUDIX hydrolase [Bacteroidaceae bacterium]
MAATVNPYVSVDCVLLGFDGEQLNVLIVRQTGKDGEDGNGIQKLPGSLINLDENLDEAAQRVLTQMTGLVQVNMIQFKAFGGTDRLKNPADGVWLERFHNVDDNHIERIVTIAYMSLLRIDRRMEKMEGGYAAQWIPIGELPRLAFDHNDIVQEAVESVKQKSTLDPTLLFDLLPRKFTATQLRVLMETVQGVSIDIKNFHKKLAQMPYVVPLEEKQDGVNHRAARYYKFKRIRKRL